jgi:hypothetical protein
VVITVTVVQLVLLAVEPEFQDKVTQVVILLDTIAQVAVAVVPEQRDRMRQQVGLVVMVAQVVNHLLWALPITTQAVAVPVVVVLLEPEALVVLAVVDWEHFGIVHVVLDKAVM